MQAVGLRGKLSCLAPADAVSLMRELLRGGRSVAALAGALDALASERRSQLAAAAREAEARGVPSLLFEVPRPKPLPIEDRRSLTLGERKSLARGSRREVLARLLADPDASVV